MDKHLEGKQNTGASIHFWLLAFLSPFLIVSVVGIIPLAFWINHVLEKYP